MHALLLLRLPNMSLQLVHLGLLGNLIPGHVEFDKWIQSVCCEQLVTTHVAYRAIIAVLLCMLLVHESCPSEQ